MRAGLVALLAALVLAAPASGGEPVLSGQRAMAFVVRLTEGGPRVAGSWQERRAGSLVAARFRQLGLPARIQTFRLPNGARSRNIVASTPGRLRAIVVAHMDGVSEGVAANDNGSGVAAMLEVASALGQRDGVLFAALGAEERVETGSSIHLGSMRLVNSLPRAVRRHVRFAVSLDMVGVGSTLNVRGIEGSPNRSSALLLRRGGALGLRPAYLADAGVSDHAELTRAGMPASLLTWRWDSCWHERCDRPARVSASKLMAAARLTIASVRALPR